MVRSRQRRRMIRPIVTRRIVSSFNGAASTLCTVRVARRRRSVVAAGGGVGGEQRSLGVPPGERPADPLLADLAHPGPLLRIVQQQRDELGELSLVVGGRVDGGVAGGDSRLPEV